MKRFAILIGIFTASLVVYAQIGGDPEPTIDPNVKQVEVVNFPSEQPVTGTVAVTSLPPMPQPTAK